MCGILGTTELVSESIFSKVLSEIKHRGPDDSGINKHGDIWLGHKRLSIIDLSPLGHQPMFSKDGSIGILFNGEIYNFKELKAELEKLGTKFTSSSDTEVILGGYEMFGISFFSKLRGMWALAISDQNLNKVFLSRDYFGMKPLYYYHNNSQFSFASEIGPLVSLHGAKPDKSAYEKYYNFGMMIGVYTGIQGVSQILPGQVMEYDLNNQSIQHSSILGSLNTKNQDNNETKSLEDILSESVRLHYVSDVPVSVLLSGGTDSSLIASLSKKEGFSPECFHVSIEGGKDAEYAKSIAKDLNLNLHTLPFTQKALHDSYDAVCSHVDIPLSDISLLPTSLVFQAVSAHAKVVLSGEGGDEFFAGYNRHKYFFGGRIKKSFSLPNLVSPSKVSLSLVYPIQSRIQSIIDLQRHDINALYVDYASVAYMPQLRNKIIEYMNQYYTEHKLADSIPAHLFWDTVFYLSDMLMIKSDRMSMMYSVEARMPFLDREVYKFVASPAQENIYNPDTTKKILKDILAKYVSPSNAYREKQGFGFSVEELMSDRIASDFLSAVLFHERNAEAFSWSALNFPDSKDKDFYILLMKKYPRFAFGIIISHAVWKKYGMS